jgi:uncharacterized protein (TIGR03067 family)
MRPAHVNPFDTWRGAMRYYPWLLIGLAILLLLTSGKKTDEDDLHALQGSWQFVAIEAEGAGVVEGVVNTSRLVITGDRFELFTPSAVHTGIIHLDPSQSPQLIDIEYTSGPEQGQRALGIYVLRDRELWVCIGLPERDRPTSFTTAPGSGRLLEYLERER